MENWMGFWGGSNFFLGGISYDSTLFRIGSHIIRIQIRHVAPPWEDHWEDQPATEFFLIGLMKLIIFTVYFFEARETTVH